MKTLIVGMGIGELYKRVNEELGHQVVTVDPNPDKKADFLCIANARAVHKKFDTSHICTPNYTHHDVANEIYYCSNIIFVEKPGFKNLYQYHKVNNGNETRIMMVKNNQYRDNIDKMIRDFRRSELITMRWINKNRVPHPGSWFTDKNLAFGGVSRDLLPHMLSFLPCFDSFIHKNDIELKDKKVYQHWNITNVQSTDYGTINPQGVYNVDDHISFTLLWKDKTINIECNWKSDIEDDRSITFSHFSSEYNTQKYELGLCPEYAYKEMIKTAIKNIDNDNFWVDQKLQDMWIHQKVLDLCV
jgi:predicted dehydrogenase